MFGPQKRPHKQKSDTASEHLNGNNQILCLLSFAVLKLWTLNCCTGHEDMLDVIGLGKIHYRM